MGRVHTEEWDLKLPRALKRVVALTVKDNTATINNPQLT